MTTTTFWHRVTHLFHSKHEETAKVVAKAREAHDDLERVLDRLRRLSEVDDDPLHTLVDKKEEGQ